METRRTPGQRAGLTRARVLAAARRLLAERGLAALTMRALAERLEVAPNALYSHISGKTELLDDVLDGVLAEVEAPPVDAVDAHAALHAIMASTYRVLLAHPDLVSLYLARQGARGANARRLGEVMIALLDRSGVTGDRAQEALRVLIVYTIGFAAFTVRVPGDAASETPLTVEAMDGNFDTGLRWLLTGITSATPLRPPVSGP